MNSHVQLHRCTLHLISAIFLFSFGVVMQYLTETVPAWRPSIAGVYSSFDFSDFHPFFPVSISKIKHLKYNFSLMTSFVPSIAAWTRLMRAHVNREIDDDVFEQLRWHEWLKKACEHEQGYSYNKLIFRNENEAVIAAELERRGIHIPAAPVMAASIARTAPLL